MELIEIYLQAKNQGLITPGCAAGLTGRRTTRINGGGFDYSGLCGRFTDSTAVSRYSGLCGRSIKYLIIWVGGRCR